MLMLLTYPLYEFRIGVRNDSWLKDFRPKVDVVFQ